MNENGTNVPAVGSGLQYLKRKKPTSTSSGKSRKAKIKEIPAQKKPRLEEQLERDDRGGAESDEFPIPSKNERRELLLSLLSSHLPSYNFTKQFINVRAEELERKEAEEEETSEDEEYKALNEALIELSRTNVAQKQIEKRPPVWTLDAQLYQHCRARKYISLFSEVVTYPVHSAITDDENVDWFLRSGESFMYPSPLGFNISLAICIGTFDSQYLQLNLIYIPATGANHMQDKSTSDEFFWQARDQLAGLMDQSDYHVASGLMIMSYLCSSLSMPQQGK